MGRNAWNDFQRAHGGQGLTKTEMSAMYHAQNGGGGGRAPSAWNTFQHAHAGQGLTSAQMAAMYREEKREQAPPPATTYYPYVEPMFSESTRREKEKMGAEQIGRFSFKAMKKQQEKELKAHHPVATPPTIDPAKPMKSVFGNVENKMQRDGGGIGTAVFGGFGGVALGTEPLSSAGHGGFGNQNTNMFGAGMPISSFPQRNLFGGGAFGVSAPSNFGVPMAQQGASPVTGFVLDSSSPSPPPNDDELFFIARAYAAKSDMRAEMSPEEVRYSERQKTRKKNAHVSFAPDAVEKVRAETKRDKATKTDIQAPVVDAKELNASKTVQTTTSQGDLDVKSTRPAAIESPRIKPTEPIPVKKNSSPDAESDKESQIKDIPPESSKTNANTSINLPAAQSEPGTEQNTQSGSLTKPEHDVPESISQEDKPEESRLNLLISDEMLIASGSAGDIYRASLGTSTPVAVKIMKNVKSKRTFARTREEIKKLQCLQDHPYLVRYYGDGPLDDGCFVGVVMELINDSRSLSSEHNRLDGKQKQSILLQLLDALVALHSNGITHRDLSAHHVLLCENDEVAGPNVKLIDFGLPTLKNAAAANASLTSLSSPLLAGFNPAYASPELLRGELRHNDEGWKRSDIFSFTVLMMELLTGEAPWEGELPVTYVNAVAKQCERPYNVEDLRIFGKTSSDLETVVTNSWDQDPLRRPSAAKMRLTLQRIFAQATEESSSVSTNTKDGGRSPRTC